MARQEPFRALLEKAMQADAPRPRPVHHVVVPAAGSPALALDHEHKRPTLEQRLDAAVLAAAPPTHAQKSPKALVPLRLDAPARPEGVDRAPPPRMLQFLLEDIHGDDTSRRLRLQPVAETGTTRVGVHTNVYRLDSALSDDSCPSRPLPLVTEEPATWVGKPVSKVMRRVGDAVAVHAFSFIDEDLVDDDTSEGPYVDRAPHAPAALGLPALSDEGEGDFGDAAEVSSAYLDELAAQLGLVHLAVPRLARSSNVDDGGVELAALARALRDDAENSDRSGEAFTSMNDEPAIGGGLDCGDDDDDDNDDGDGDVEAITDAALNDARAALKVTDPMRVVRRPSMPSIVVASDLQHADDDEDDDDRFDPLADDEPSNTLRLPASLLSSFEDDVEVTPPHGTQRPSLQAPDAVRFVVAEAPARPRPAALTSEDLERNKARAHDLYLVALDDIACRDHDSAVVHLQLALAYDDSSLYVDLLAQIEKSHKRAS